MRLDVGILGTAHSADMSLGKVSNITCRAAAEDEARTPARLDLTTPLQPAAAAQLPRPATGVTADGGIDLLKAASARVAALEVAMRARDSQLAAAQSELQAMQVQLPVASTPRSLVQALAPMHGLCKDPTIGACCFLWV